MELLGSLLGLVLIIVLIVVGICVILFPIIFDISFHDVNDEYPLCHGFAFLQFIGVTWVIGTIYSGETDEAGFAVIATIIVTIIAMIRAYKRVKNLGGDASEAAMAVLAQMLIPVSAIIILLYISHLMDSFKDKSKKD